uniref:hypothetical protein n=1 Tax=Flavobacterium sp. TaxID=239 RepID=UPI00404A0358
MSLNKNTGSIISEADAKSLIRAFKIENVSQETSFFIGANNVQNILNQEGCIGIRIHNGYDATSQTYNLILVGVDENERELLSAGIIYEELDKCPTMCPIDGLGI